MLQAAADLAAITSQADLASGPTLPYNYIINTDFPVPASPGPASDPSRALPGFAFLTTAHWQFTEASAAVNPQGFQTLGKRPHYLIADAKGLLVPHAACLVPALNLGTSA